MWRDRDPSGPLAVTPGLWGPLTLPTPPTPQLLPTLWHLPGQALTDALSWRRPGGQTTGQVGVPPCAPMDVHGSHSARPGRALASPSPAASWACQWPRSGVGTWGWTDGKQGMRKEDRAPLWGPGRHHMGHSFTHSLAETGGKGLGHSSLKSNGAQGQEIN